MNFRLNNGWLYWIGILIWIFLYVMIIYLVNKSKDDKKKKVAIFVCVAITTILGFIVKPNNSDDIYYYIGVGRADSSFAENPYENYFSEVQQRHQEDSVITEAPSLNVVYTYGPLWRNICKALSTIPLNTMNEMLYLYKFVNVLIHLLNCVLIYKISKDKKLLKLGIYALNPLIIFECLINCHNDIFVLFFVLLAIYLKQKDKIGLGVVSILLGTLIKYVPVIFLPYIIGNKKIKNYIVYLVGFVIGYLGLSYLETGNFNNSFKVLQQTSLFANNWENILISLKVSLSDTLKISFIAKIVFAIIFMTLVLKEYIKQESKQETYRIIAMLFYLLVITNFRNWYITWIFALIPILNKEGIFKIIAFSISALISNSIFYMIGGGYIFAYLIFLTNIITYLILVFTIKIYEKYKSNS